MKKNIILVLTLLSSQCTLRELPPNKLLDELFDSGTPYTGTAINLISPNTENKIIDNTVLMQLRIANPEYGIKAIIVNGATFSSNITFSRIIDSILIEKTIFLSNGGTYNTEQGKYDINVQAENGEHQISQSNFTIPIQISHIHLENFTVPERRPLNQAQWDSAEIRITSLESGPKINKVSIKGSILGGGSSFVTNINPPSNDPITILFREITPIWVNFYITAQISIYSTTGPATITNFHIN